MAARVESFCYNLISDVFNSKDTAPLVIEAILRAGGCDPGPKAVRVEDPAQWTVEKIKARGGVGGHKGPAGNFDD
jgi:hypothetical protein